MPSLRAIVSFFASMRLTVLILFLLAVLTLLGTLAQVDKGIYEVQKQYFDSLIAIADLPVDNPFTGRPFSLPLPGAYLLLAVLAINLITGGIIGLKKGTRTAGILVVHLGVLLLLLAGFVKLNFSQSGHLALYEGRSGSQYVSFHEYELVLSRQEGEDLVERSVPAEGFEDASPQHPVTVTAAGLPFRVEIERYFPNCEPMPKGPRFDVDVPVIDGSFLRRLPAAGAQKEREFQFAGCYATVVEATGKRIPGILWGWERRPSDDHRYPFTFESNGNVWGLDLRRITWDLPFQVRLDRFVKRDRPGSSTVAEFSSYITVRDGNSERSQHITMNAPLRQGGLVFYQTSWGPQPPRSGPPWYSVFEVSRNPSDRWEIAACTVIAVGLLFHFLRKLFRYISGETAKARTEAS